jgi:hypothetical protein
MRSYVLFVAVFVMLSCGTLFSSNGALHVAPQSPRIAVAGATGADACPQQQTVIDLIADLEKCEAQVKACASPPSTAHDEGSGEEEPRTHVVVRYATKPCADAGPVIEPVPSTKCMRGQLCLDDDGQRVLAKNLAAYAAWVQRVKDCESK